MADNSRMTVATLPAPTCALVDAAPSVSAPRASRELRRATVGYWLLVALVAAVGVGKAVRSDVMDPDVFWHLRVADQILREGVRPMVDSLSYASLKQPWAPYSWLAELAMKWSFDAGGYRLALAFRAALIAGTLALVALACSACAGRERRMASAVAVLWFAYLGLPYLSFRPATMATLLLALCAWLLLRDRTSNERTRSVWLLLPVTALIVNLHLTAVVVPMFVAALLAGSIWEQYRGEGDARRRTRRYALLLCGVTLACLATPLLPGVLRTAWHYQSRDVMVASDIITEMRPVYRGGLALVTVPLLLATIALAIRGRERVRAGEWLWLAVGAALMLRLGRFAPIFGLISAPVLAATLPRRLTDRTLAKPLVHAAVCASLLTCAWHVAGAFPRAEVPLSTWLNSEPRRFFYPCAAADFVAANLEPPAGRPGRLINEFTWGGYLAWRLGPGYQTLLDGRTQMFAPDFWHKTMLAPDDATRTAFFRTLDADVAIIPVDKSRFRGSVEAMGWRSVYRDAVAEVLVARDE